MLGRRTRGASKLSPRPALPRNETGGGFDKLLIEFMEVIPPQKLPGFPESKLAIWRNAEFRPDMQGVHMGQSIARWTLDAN